MERQLLERYKQELRWLRSRAGLFAAEHPDAAARLGISDDACSDPHTERLLESTALLAAGVQRRIDGACPAVSCGILDAFGLAASPVTPSLVLARMTPTPDLDPGGFVVPRAAAFQATVAASSESCILTTCQDMTLRPITITRSTEHEQDIARLSLPIRARGALKLEFKRIGEATLADLGVEELTLHAIGPAGGAVHAALLSPNTRLFARSAPDPAWVEVSIGLADMTPSIAAGDAHSRSAQDALARECLALPERFRGVCIGGLAKVCQHAKGSTLEIVAAFGAPPRDLAISAPIELALHCVPLANVYRKRFELRVTSNTNELWVDKARPDRYDIVAIDEVRTLDEKRSEIPRFGAAVDGGRAMFMDRRVARWDGAGERGASAYHLDFVLADGSAAHTGSQKLSVSALVTDGAVMAASAGRLVIEPAESFPIASIESVSDSSPASAVLTDGEEAWLRNARATAQPLADGATSLAHWFRGLDATEAANTSLLARGILGTRVRPARSVSARGISHGIEVELQLGAPISNTDGSATLVGSLLHRAIAWRLSWNAFIRTVVTLDSEEVARFCSERGHDPVI
ncbi:MAG: type VI secretion system baseplate subunit TssF [Phycisphaera sp.]|nr:MAG: type VI secretion system baseplate subunit TssF [Phycisphaera sp.]